MLCVRNVKRSDRAVMKIWNNKNSLFSIFFAHNLKENKTETETESFVCDYQNLIIEVSVRNNGRSWLLQGFEGKNDANFF